MEKKEESLLHSIASAASFHGDEGDIFTILTKVVESWSMSLFSMKTMACVLSRILCLCFQIR